MALRDAIRVLALKHMRRAIGDDVVDWAESELNAGNISESIIEITSYSKPAHWDDLSKLFARALRESGYGIPPFEECLRTYAGDIACDVIDGRVSPTLGCSEIALVCFWLDYPQGMYSDAWMELESGYDPRSCERIESEELEQEIHRYAKLLIDGQSGSTTPTVS